ncbi:hypothetical protein CJ030_MR1G006386 [Morella rubra]|uniref:Uncharacterized protein n=1 Tax=Morella rubra TaxID=262757 RepID=A0A6A1WL04_9ROSI|nr:hypothetical protein CJ030_MR1G006386 [Morella rubra]
MAQLDRTQKYGYSPKSPNSPTFEQLRGEEASKWSPTSSSLTSGKDSDHEEDHSHHHKKSVLTKVKEKAKKLRHSLSKKKHNEDGSTTPSWGVSLDDEEDEEEDAEYLGAPMYESELAPEEYKETARQHPREVHMVSEKDFLESSVDRGADQDQKEKPSSPNKTITETVAEKLGPAYAAVSDATQAIASKLQGLTVSVPAAPRIISGKANAATDSPQTHSAPAAPQSGSVSAGEQTWDKGVSVKEYLMHKLEPGEDERALSEVISEAMSPRRTPGDIGVVEKVREAVTSLLRNQVTSQYAAANSAKNSTSQMPKISTNAHSAKNSPTRIPISTNPHEADIKLVLEQHVSWMFVHVRCRANSFARNLARWAAQENFVGNILAFCIPRDILNCDNAHHPP